MAENYCEEAEREKVMNCSNYDLLMICRHIIWSVWSFRLSPECFLYNLVCGAWLVEWMSASVDPLWLGLVSFERCVWMEALCLSVSLDSRARRDMLPYGWEQRAKGYEWPNALEDPWTPGAWDMSLPMISFTTAEGEKNTKLSIIREKTQEQLDFKDRMLWIIY